MGGFAGFAAGASGAAKGFLAGQRMARENALYDLQKKRQEDDLALRRSAQEAAFEARYAKEQADQQRQAEQATRRDESAYSAPILSDINKRGSTPSAMEALGLAKDYARAPDYKRNPAYDTGPIDPSKPSAPTEEFDGVFADPSSFVQGKDDVLAKRAALLAKAPGEVAPPAVKPPAAAKSELPARLAGQKDRLAAQEKGRHEGLGVKYGKDIEPYAAVAADFDVFESAIKDGVLDNNAAQSFLFRVPYVRNFLDAKTADARSAAEAILAEKMRQASGLAVTEGEAARQYMATLLGGGIPTDFMKAGWARFRQATNQRIASVNARYPKEVVDGYWNRVRSPSPGTDPLVLPGKVPGPAGALAPASGPKEGDKATSKSGKPMTFKGGAWVYDG